MMLKRLASRQSTKSPMAESGSSNEGEYNGYATPSNPWLTSIAAPQHHPHRILRVPSQWTSHDLQFL